MARQQMHTFFVCIQLILAGATAIAQEIHSNRLYSFIAKKSSFFSFFRFFLRFGQKINPSGCHIVCMNKIFPKYCFLMFLDFLSVSDCFF